MNFQQPPVQQLQVPAAVSNIGNNIGNALDQAKTGFNSSVSGFSEQAQTGVNASQEFLQSNTIVAKFVFIILIIIAFLFLLALGINILQYFVNPPTNPYLFKGSVSGTADLTIPSDPKQEKSVQINRSNNESKGLEFTWSYWLYINDLDVLSNNAKPCQHIFNKGDTNYVDGIASVNNGPGVYLVKPATDKPNSATLRIIMDTAEANANANTIDIDNCPIKKWFHVAMRMQNTIFDVYVNGTIVNRLIMTGIPKQNYNDVNVGKNGGFNGKISNLRYYSHSLNTFEINNIIYSGPDTSTIDSALNTTNNYSYLSSSWYKMN